MGATYNSYDGVNPWQNAGGTGVGDKGSSVFCSGVLPFEDAVVVFSLNDAGLAAINNWIRKTEINNGRIRGITLLILWIILPSKVAPREIWAFLNLSASLISVGINLNESVIINVNSFVGNPIFLSGIKNLSSASVISIGEVVNVSSDASNTNSANRIE